jgi:hypothetical protein
MMRRLSSDELRTDAKTLRARMRDDVLAEAGAVPELKPFVEIVTDLCVSSYRGGQFGTAKLRAEEIRQIRIEAGFDEPEEPELARLLEWGRALQQAAGKYKSADDVPASHIDSHWEFVREVVAYLERRRPL